MKLAVIATPPEPVKPIREFHLFLTEDEANVLLAVCASVGGEPFSPRSVIQEIYDRLVAELPNRVSGTVNYNGTVTTITGSVYFRS